MKAKITGILVLVFAAFLLASSGIYAQTQCNSCTGSGAQNCIRCGANGSYPCPNCSGAGGRWEICNCNNGYVTMPDGSQQVCNYCLGEGRKWHSCYNPLCGSGTVNCNFCGGNGRITCPSCNGTGVR
jgi:hypothetical protein